MSIFGGTKATIKAANELGKTVFSGLDELSTSKEEKLLLWKEFSSQLLAAQLAADQQSTQRHQADMTSDSWLSKNVRPLVLLILLALYITCLLMDSLCATIVIEKHYIDILENLLTLAIGYYFISRFGQHIAKSGAELFKGRQRKRDRKPEPDE